MKYLLKQVEELASNRDQQPSYIQWTATADPNGLLNASELHDGWYVIDSFEPDYNRNVVMGIVQCRMTVTEVAPAAPRSVAMAYSGGALTTDYSGTPINLVGLPLGSSAEEIATSRAGAEGGITTLASPLASPEPFVLSATISNIFKGGVHVYDTINTGSNPVPLAGGTFVNANWVEVFGTDHNFQGDCVVTNGLRLHVFVAAATSVTNYLWNTGAATANWINDTSLWFADSAGTTGNIRSYSLVRIGAEEVALTVNVTPTTATLVLATFRLQRGRYETRVDVKELTVANSGNYSLELRGNGFTTGILFNGFPVALDTRLASDQGATGAADPIYGYNALFNPSTSFPFIFGFLYQKKPANQVNGGSGISILLGDTSGPLVNEQRSYGFYAIPYGVSGSYSPANLQQEMESATLSGGFVSAADAGSSGGNAAKLPSGSAIGSIAQAALWTPAAGKYNVWFRVRVTSTASGTIQIRLGLYDNGSGWVAGQFTDFSPSNFTTSYAWYRAGTVTGFTPAAATPERFRAEGITNAAATDIWVDEAVLVPLSLGSASGPQDIWQQFMYDRSVRLVRQ